MLSHHIYHIWLAHRYTLCLRHCGLSPKMEDFHLKKIPESGKYLNSVFYINSPPPHYFCWINAFVPLLLLCLCSLFSISKCTFRYKQFQLWLSPLKFKCHISGWSLKDAFGLKLRQLTQWLTPSCGEGLEGDYKSPPVKWWQWYKGFQGLHLWYGTHCYIVVVYCLDYGYAMVLESHVTLGVGTERVGGFVGRWGAG